MKRREFVSQLIKEGFSEKTLLNLSDNQIKQLHERVVGEATTVAMTKLDLNKPQDAGILKNLMKDPVKNAEQIKKITFEGDLNEKKLTKKQSKVMDTDKDGDIDSKDLSTLRSKKGDVNESVCPICGMKDCKCKDKKHGEKGLKESKKSEKWIQKAVHPSKKGSLKKALGVKKDETIPVKKLKAAAKKKGKLGQRARFAMNVKGLKENKNEVNQWIENLVNENYYPLTSKKEILNIIQSKLKK